jgi:hypothetical protein
MGDARGIDKINLSASSDEGIRFAFVNHIIWLFEFSTSSSTRPGADYFDSPFPLVTGSLSLNFRETLLTQCLSSVGVL